MLKVVSINDNFFLLVII